MKKRIIALSLAVCMLFSMAAFTPVSAADDTADASAVTYCGLTEHVHAYECFERELVCGVDLDHQHSDACKEKTWLCGFTQDFHEHNSGCSFEEKLICGVDLDTPHTHGEACYTRKTTCGLVESDGHVHTTEANCFDANGTVTCKEQTEAHKHTVDCYNLECTVEAHKHIESCYKAPSVLNNLLNNLTASGDEQRDGESPSPTEDNVGTDGNTDNDGSSPTVGDADPASRPDGTTDVTGDATNDDNANVGASVPAPATCTCNAAEGEDHADDCALTTNVGAPVPAPATCTCNAAEGEDHAEDCAINGAPNGETVPAEGENDAPTYGELCNRLLAAESVEAMYELMFDMANNDTDNFYAMTYEEIQAIIAKVQTLPCETEGMADAVIQMMNEMPNGEAPLEPAVWEGWTPMTDAVYHGGNLGPGKYYLTEDIHIKAEFAIGGNTTIDLNGYAIVQDQGKAHNNDVWNSGGCAGTGHSRVMYIHSNANVVIQDSAPEREHRGSLVKIGRYVGSNYTGVAGTTQWLATDQAEYWVYDGVGSTVIKGGIITGGFTVYSGGGISVQGNAKLTINGGTIVGNRTCASTYVNPTTGKGIGAGGGGGIQVTHYSEVTMNGGALMYNWADGWGGGVTVAANGSEHQNQAPKFNFVGGTIAENCSQGAGGGINVTDGGIATVGSSSTIPVIRNNSLFDRYYTGNGGGIHVQSAQLYYYSGHILNNFASNCGGGIYCYVGGNINASGNNCIIEGNTADYGAGGGIFIQYGDVTMNGGIIRNNKTIKQYAGGVGVRIGTLTMVGGEISGNYAASYGGGAAITAQNNVTPHGDHGDRGCSATLTNTKVFGNSSKGDGGGLYISVANSTADLNVTVSGGSITNNTSPSKGGAICLEGGTLTVKDNPTISGNTAKYGGTFYVADKDRTNVNAADANKPYKINANWGKVTNVYDGVDFIYDIKPGIFNIYSGTITNNKATVDGGLAYVTGSQCQANVYGGTYTENSAAVNGGAIAVVGGNMTIADGTFTSNTAVKGGAAYVSGGNLKMTGGTIKNCMATNGGAAYINDGNFTMETGILQNNGSLDKTEYGGAVYVNNGNVTIGLKDCTQNTPLDAHKAPGFHPIVKDNEAAFGGGITASGGDLLLYCCNVLDNKSDNAGTGMNIFVQGGNFNQYLYGASVGVETEEKDDHGIVMVGGNMNILGGDGSAVIKINYHSNYSVDVTWTPEAPEDYWLNLPYCPKEWSDEQAKNELVFVGWGDHLAGSEAHSVRNVYDYYPIGHAIQIKDMKDNNGEVHLYAIWAPVDNHIHYAYSLDTVKSPGNDRLFNGTIVQTNVPDPMFGGQTPPTTYEFALTTETISVPTPSKEGYVFVKWLMYANSEKISNWNTDAYQIDKNGYPVVDAEGMPVLDPNNPTELKVLYNKDTGMVDRYAWKGTVQQNFGDITLVALFVPKVSYTIVDDIPEETASVQLTSGGTASAASVTEVVEYGDSAVGAVVSANPKYRIMGWYLDEACTEPVPTEWVTNEGRADNVTRSTIKPKLAEGQRTWDGGKTFYAKLEIAIADLTIKKDVSGETDADQTFMFRVTGAKTGVDTYVTVKAGQTVKLKDLLVDTYTVTELTDWSWRYTPVNGEGNEQATQIVDLSGVHKTLTFTNKRTNNSWLDSECGAHNVFKKG